MVGLYVDLDFVSLIPMSIEINSGGVLLGSMATTADEVDHSIPNAWMYAARPHHPFWLVVLDLALARLTDDYVERATGPILLYDAVQRYRRMDRDEALGLQSRILSRLPNVQNLPCGSRDDIRLLTPDVLYPISWSTGHRNRLVEDFRMANTLSHELIQRVPKSMSTRAFTFWEHSWGDDPLTFDNDDEQ